MQLKLVENHLVLLPGMDGTGSLFGPLLSVLPPEFTASVIDYPGYQPLSYKELIPVIRGKIPWDRPFTLVAESFSGPLALEFAAGQPHLVNAVVLVCTFVVNPLPAWLKWARLPIQDMWFKKSLSDSFLRKYLLDDQTPEILLHAVRQAVASVEPSVLADRARQILAVDARVALQNCRKPILYLLGEQDQLLGKRGWEAMAAFRPGMTTVEINGPHLLLQARPRECFNAIDRFLNNLKVSQAQSARPPEAAA